jgi:hypothetical protein
MLVHLCDRCKSEIKDKHSAEVTITFHNSLMKEDKYADICHTCARLIITVLDTEPATLHKYESA